MYPEIPLPPKPILTRWGTWLEAVEYYAEHIDSINNVLLALDSEDAVSIDTAKTVTCDISVKNDLAHIQHTFSCIIKTLKSLQNRHLSLSESFEIINSTVEQLNRGRGKVADAVRAKVDTVLSKNPGYEELKKESKRQILQWNHPGSPPPKKSKAIYTSAGKVMLTFFFGQEGPLLIDLLQHRTTVNVQRYLQTLTTLRQAIKSKRPGKLTRGAILLHDNARPHTANTITAFLQKSKCKRFTSDDDVKQYVRNWFTTEHREFYETAIHRLVSQWDKCLSSQGQYF
ncbi:hypothetical protein ANN_19344 [Periplaneta americana]|uniref:Uncharacterized protein n=1 Tax=Periplaneta americana TaxID=6978 RepID=A0ABQ8S9M2_PERAM|nr:hypothetical protein ANN_19344 [Periplaneta americana]